MDRLRYFIRNIQLNTLRRMANWEPELTYMVGSGVIVVVMVLLVVLSW